MKYCPKRIEKINEWAVERGYTVTDDNIIEMMDKWLIDLWNSQVGKKDTVYILGDFSFHNAEENKKILSKLKGKKFLILGNHDGNSDKLDNYFEQITQIKEFKYKDESGETFCFELCHYAMLTWNRKEHGTIQLMGHSHGNLDGFNENSNDLRVDVGIDGKLANYKFLTPDDILVYFYQKAATKDFENYVQALRNNGKNEVSKVKFDFCGEFHEGFAWVELNNKYNWVCQDNGQLLSEQWFDDCSDFYEGFAWVELNNKYNWVCQDNGQLLSEQWFDDCGDFYEGFAWAELNSEHYLMRQDGVLCDINTKEPIEKEN